MTLSVSCRILHKGDISEKINEFLEQIFKTNTWKKLFLYCFYTLKILFLYIIFFFYTFFLLFAFEESFPSTHLKLFSFYLKKLFRIINFISLILKKVRRANQNKTTYTHIYIFIYLHLSRCSGCYYLGRKVAKWRHALRRFISIYKRR